MSSTQSYSTDSTTTPPARAIKKLSGVENYDLWETQMKLYLSTRNLWNITIGLEVSKETNDNSWAIRDSIAHGEIGLYISDELQSYHIQTENQSASDLWTILAKAYKKSDPDTLAFQLTKFISMKWNPSKDSLQSFIDQFQSAFVKLEELGRKDDPHTASHATTKPSLHIGPTAKATLLLAALPDSWKNFTQIHQAQSSNYEIIVQKALQADFDTSNNSKTDEKSKDKAYITNNGSATIECTWCKKRGFNAKNHIYKDCRKLKASKEKNQNTTDQQSTDSANVTSDTQDWCYISSSTTESSRKTHSKILLDCGASNHFFNHRSFFTSMKPLDPEDADQVLFGDNKSSTKKEAIGTVKIELDTGKTI
jgi:hypothetical protein